MAADKISASPLIGSAVERELSGAATGFAPFADRYAGKRYVGGYSAGSSTFGDYGNGYDSHLGNYEPGRNYYLPFNARFLGREFSRNNWKLTTILFWPRNKWLKLIFEIFSIILHFWSIEGGGYSGYPGYGGYGGYLGYNMYGGGLGGYSSYPYNSYYYGSRIGLGGYPSTYSRLGYSTYPSSYYTGGANYGSSIIGGGLGTAHSYLPSLGGAYGHYGPAALTGTVY